jgi:PleD family two-component response regulator
MTLFGKEVLLVGQSFQAAHLLTDRLHKWGFRCHFAGELHSACIILSSVRVHLVLSDTHLPDASGAELLGVLVGLPVSAFLCVPLESSCFWLPAIDAGIECLGMPALRPAEFASELEDMARRLGAAA